MRLRDINKQTDRQTVTESGRQTNGDRQPYIDIQTQAETKTNIQSDRQTDTDAHRGLQIQADKQTEKDNVTETDRNRQRQ